jgi:hypothetical protein
MIANKGPFWTCPKCGHQFVTRNLWHSCGKYALEDHFKGKLSLLHETFDQLVAIANGCGPVTIYAQKTRIVFMVRVRFASVIVRKSSLDLGLWTTHRVAHPLLQKTEVFGPRSYYPHFRLTKPNDVDPALKTLVRETYQERL